VTPVLPYALPRLRPSSAAAGRILGRHASVAFIPASGALPGLLANSNSESSGSFTGPDGGGSDNGGQVLALGVFHPWGCSHVHVRTYALHLF
jgi:hypothetical protein